MAPLAQATLIGHLAADPEQRYTAEGRSVLTFRMAVNVRRKNRDSNEWEDGTLWWRVTHFGGGADRLAERLTKAVRSW